MATESLLQENPRPTEAEIKAGLSGNLCRCTGYNMIIDGVKRAAERGDGLW
jgi:carbon-monoxide dehydrogenase small subunit